MDLLLLKVSKYLIRKLIVCLSESLFCTKESYTISRRGLHLDFIGADFKVF